MVKSKQSLMNVTRVPQTATHKQLSNQKTKPPPIDTGPVKKTVLLQETKTQASSSSKNGSEHNDNQDQTYGGA